MHYFYLQQPRYRISLCKNKAICSSSKCRNSTNFWLYLRVSMQAFIIICHTCIYYRGYNVLYRSFVKFHCYRRVFVCHSDLTKFKDFIFGIHKWDLAISITKTSYFLDLLAVKWWVFLFGLHFLCLLYLFSSSSYVPNIRL